MLFFFFLFKFIHSLSVLTLPFPNVDSSPSIYPFVIIVDTKTIILTTKGSYHLKSDDDRNYFFESFSLGNPFTPDQTSNFYSTFFPTDYNETTSVLYMLFMNNKMIILTYQEEGISNLQYFIGEVSTQSRVNGMLFYFNIAVIF